MDQEWARHAADVESDVSAEQDKVSNLRGHAVVRPSQVVELLQHVTLPILINVQHLDFRILAAIFTGVPIHITVSGIRN